ncbi:ankyrin repeat domain-containing protein 6 isoform X3 [Nilaparvata lugens]|uniref:ankyrin repeat domain-containing protein 6 isoform X1 n=1 Tax=Nilaparvata lugens TaxID=108931 RepID=UPI00193CBF9E|nr:ankyrin repeat domain-containing protein 6 isoform X1 [Nilaparvata lugens]XP_039277281.1 ankyrin repeat domain-containing protein 6 isoform X2 [Nilaparvata lugens]XP_039277286.1 ankyrin repeat domain-containing protein 6 isoform X3 [Nilaparvata lugens]
MLGEQLREAAAEGNNREVVRLLSEGAKITPDRNGRTALHLAAAGGFAEVTAALLLAKADPNAVDSVGCSPLQVAAAEGHLEIAKQLIKYGADVNKQDTVHGNTALHEASWKGFSQMVATLCKVKANMNIKNYGGFAALHLCCQNGHNQSCRELLIYGCNPDLQNNYGDTPLHTSARYGHAGVTRILISAQCRVSDQNKNGDSALHIAAAMGRRKLTRILLEAKCNKNIQNKQHETARDIASRKELTEILKIIDEVPDAPSSKKGKKKEKEAKENKTSKHKHDKKKQKVQFMEAASLAGGKQWSPYGCHYYPDPKDFPQPNLDSLPNEPLKKGEQYFLDLAGNICKGPVGVGYTCYCAPFFRHVEEKLERDKQELKEQLTFAEQRLGRRVESLERKTESRLSQIAHWLADHRSCGDASAVASMQRTRSLDGELSVQLESLQVDDHVPKHPLKRFWKSQFLNPVRTECPDLVSSHHSYSPTGSVIRDHAKQDDLLPEWRKDELRKSVQEIMLRVNSHHREQGEGREEESRWREEERAGGVSSDDDSSDADDDGEDRVVSWQEVERLPYRSRSAVYEREPPDSGYSTKICSNSQGPSPSLSGRLESDGLAPATGIFKSQAAVIDHSEYQPPPPTTTQLTNKCQNIYTGEASLV